MLFVGPIYLSIKFCTLFSTTCHGIPFIYLAISNTSQVNTKSQLHQLATLVPSLKQCKCSFLRITTTNDNEFNRNRGVLVVTITKASPEVAGDVVSGALSIPEIPFSIPASKLIARQSAETTEKIANTVGKVAEEVDKAAEELGESLPEGGLKQMVALVEDMAEETVKDAQVIEDLMDKVGELDHKLEALMNKNSKGADTST